MSNPVLVPVELAVVVIVLGPLPVKQEVFLLLVLLLGEGLGGPGSQGTGAPSWGVREGVGWVCGGRG